MSTTNLANRRMIEELQRGLAQARYIRLVAAGANDKISASSFRKKENKLRHRIRALGGNV